MCTVVSDTIVGNISVSTVPFDEGYNSAVHNTLVQHMSCVSSITLIKRIALQTLFHIIVL